jgi:hypothetical protein
LDFPPKIVASLCSSLGLDSSSVGSLRQLFGYGLWYSAYGRTRFGRPKLIIDLQRDLRTFLILHLSVWTHRFKRTWNENHGTKLTKAREWRRSHGAQRN